MSTIPSGEELNVYQVMAKKAAESNFFRNMGSEAGLLSIMLIARELGVQPMSAIMGGLNVIQGKVEISPRLMNTLIRKAGHKLEITDDSNTVCKIKGTRSDTKEEYEACYTIDDAKKAGLYRAGGSWDKYPSDMLFARCLSRLARRLFADVVANSYVEGEISGDDEVQPIKETSPISYEEFLSALKEKFGDEYSFEDLDLYVKELEESKKVKAYKIMEQALSDALAKRFALGWKKWYENRKAKEE